jgi:transcriptional regulator with XRE-family HTH domain
MVKREIAVFARNVSGTRSEARLSQAEVSARSGIHPTEVSRIERGLRDPRLSTLVRLARALEVEPGRLLDRIEPDESRLLGPSASEDGMSAVEPRARKRP